MEMERRILEKILPEYLAHSIKEMIDEGAKWGREFGLSYIQTKIIRFFILMDGSVRMKSRSC